MRNGANVLLYKILLEKFMICEHIHARGTNFYEQVLSSVRLEIEKIIQIKSIWKNVINKKFPVSLGQNGFCLQFDALVW